MCSELFVTNKLSTCGVIEDAIEHKGRGNCYNLFQQHDTWAQGLVCLLPTTAAAIWCNEFYFSTGWKLS
jgi:hypothetical protein